MRHRGLTALLLCLASAIPMTSSACRKKEAGPAGSGAAAPSAAAPRSEAATAPSTGAGSLVDDKAVVDGRPLPVAHSAWDLGQTSDVFDANPATFARTEKASPAVLEIRFPEPRPIKGIWLKMGGHDFRVAATVKMVGAGAPKVYTKEFPNSGFDPELELDFGGETAPVESLRIEVFDLGGGDGHIHFRTVRLL